jgi:hypothetical protein
MANLRKENVTRAFSYYSIILLVAAMNSTNVNAFGYKDDHNDGVTLYTTMAFRYSPDDRMDKPSSGVCASSSLMLLGLLLLSQQQKMT